MDSSSRNAATYVCICFSNYQPIEVNIYKGIKNTAYCIRQMVLERKSLRALIREIIVRLREVNAVPHMSKKHVDEKESLIYSLTMKYSGELTH